MGDDGYKNICILAVKNGINVDDLLMLQSKFKHANVTLLAPKNNQSLIANKPKFELWHDAERSGFLKVLTIARRMSWCSFDLVINWEQVGIDNALCYLLFPKPKIITKDKLGDII